MNLVAYVNKESSETQMDSITRYCDMRQHKLLGVTEAFSSDCLRWTLQNALNDQADGLIIRAEEVIGSHPEIAAVKELLSQRCKLLIVIGDNAALADDDTKSAVEAATIGALWNHYYEGHVKHRCKTAKQMLTLYNKYLVELENKLAAGVTPFDVQALHNKLGSQSGRTLANRVLEILRRIYSYSIEWQLYKGDNPAKVVKPFPKRERMRFVEVDEMPRLFDALNKHATEKTRDFFMCCLFTGQRLSTVSSMRWQDLRLERGVWYIPAEAPGNKTGEDFELPLADEVVEILKRRRESIVHFDWVFPARRPSKRGYIAPPYRQWYRIRKAADLTDVVIHDLRRTFGTYENALIDNPFVIARSMGHKSLASTRIYARLQRDPLKVAIDKTVKSLIATGSQSIV